MFQPYHLNLKVSFSHDLTRHPVKTCYHHNFLQRKAHLLKHRQTYKKHFCSILGIKRHTLHFHKIVWVNYLAPNLTFGLCRTLITRTHTHLLRSKPYIKGSQERGGGQVKRKKYNKNLKNKTVLQLQLLWNTACVFLFFKTYQNTE